MTYYITDGTEDCFYTAVFDCYRDRDGTITSRHDVQLTLDGGIKRVRTDVGKAARVKRKIEACDGRAAKDIALMLRSCAPDREQRALEYIRVLVENGRPVRDMTNLPAVLAAEDTIKKVTGELHNMKGFLRFMENDRGILYAPFSPDNDITDLLAPHFAERLKSQKFVIHDVRRKIAAMYDGREIVICHADGADIYLSEYEKVFEELWRLYYKSVNIEEQPHERQMKGYMPVRYWKFMPEKRDG